MNVDELRKEIEGLRRIGLSSNVATEDDESLQATRALRQFIDVCQPWRDYAAGCCEVSTEEAPAPASVPPCDSFEGSGSVFLFRLRRNAQSVSRGALRRRISLGLERGGERFFTPQSLS